MFIDFETHDAKYNMDFDEKLLNDCENNNIDFALRLYAWDKPSISLGRNQKISGINEEYCKLNNIPMVRRITGGRALLHDNELTYCVVCSKTILQDGTNVISDYKEISGILIEALNIMGVDAYYGEKIKSNIGAGYCMNLSTVCDINVNNKKFIGSAQFRSNTHILQHGAIPFAFNKDMLNEIFMGKVDFEHIIGLDEINPNFDIQKFQKQLKLSFENHFNKKG